MKLNNINCIDVPKEMVNTIPGRGDLRISLTTCCNLECAHCHNEGVSPPWKTHTQNISINKITELISLAEQYGAQSVKFTGGEPTVYPYFFELIKMVRDWKKEYLTIKKWGISTNGVLFLKENYFNALVESDIDNICVGVDSVSETKNSKPSSPKGVKGNELFNKFLIPLRKKWSDRSIKVNVVYDGDDTRVKQVVERCLQNSINVSILEIHGTKDGVHIRNKFWSLLQELKVKYSCHHKYNEQLNEHHLFTNDRLNRISFYQDHCADMDCGHCRNIHLRVSPNKGEIAIVPCFTKNIDGLYPITEKGNLNSDRFKKAISYTGRGPNWSDLKQEI